jgi:hypothetical protein
MIPGLTQVIRAFSLGGNWFVAGSNIIIIKERHRLKGSMDVSEEDTERMYPTLPEEGTEIP